MADILAKKHEDLLSGKKIVFFETDGAAVTSGHVDTGLKNVEYACAVSLSGANAVRVELNTDSSGVKAGSVKLTFSSGHDCSGYAVGI